MECNGKSICIMYNKKALELESRVRIIFRKIQSRVLITKDVEKDHY